MKRFPHGLVLALVAALLAAPSLARAVPWPRFALFGWLSPPPALTDSLRVADYARAGFNVMLPAWRDSGFAQDTQRRLDLARQNGIVCIAWDRRLRAVNPDSAATLAHLDSVVAQWRDHPAFLAYYLGDEPTDKRILLVAKFCDRLRARDPEHPGWNNLFGRASFASHDGFMDYLRRYVAAVHPTVLCNDHYDLLEGGALGQLVENVRGVAEVARGARLPFWGIILSTQHGALRAPSEGELRWQIGTWLSWGARGIGWFTYWPQTADSSFKTALVDSLGAPTFAFERARRINADTRAIGEILAGATWRSTVYTGFVPAYGDSFVPDGLVAGVSGHVALGAFEDAAGNALLLVVNGDSASARDVSLVPARTEQGADVFSPRSSCWFAATRGAGGAIELPLPAGDFALVRLARGPAAPRARIALDLWPNPARGLLRLRAWGCGAPGHVSIRDARGRLVRALEPAPDGGERTWDGMRADGGRAAPGMYFVRLEAGGAAVTRSLLWRGTPN